MTVKTRRRVFAAAIIVALTLPAEVILLKALQEPNEQVAAQVWANSLDAVALEAAGSSVQSYSFKVRKSIMKALPPGQRSKVWQDHVGAYILQHPELSADAVIALHAAQSALTPHALSQPTAAERASLNAAAGQIEVLLGRDTALYLLHELGPRVDNLASAHPLSMRLATIVRNQFALLARGWDCDCSGDFGCGGYSAFCGSEYCQWDVEWPMCGWGWMDVCDGLCQLG